jgi:hypothetical protein
MIFSMCEDARDRGVLHLGTSEGLIRYQPQSSTPPRPILTIQTDREYQNVREVKPLAQSSLVSFRFQVADFKTRPENRLFRWQIASGRRTAAELGASKSWSRVARATQFEWSTRTNSPGEYTVGVQFVDRDWNYSEPAVAMITVVPLWYLNGWIIAPAGTTFAGLAALALVTTARARKRKRETERLREKMLSQERQARGSGGAPGPGQRRTSAPSGRGGQPG